MRAQRVSHKPKRTRAAYRLHRYIDLPNFFAGARTVDENLRAIGNTDWAKFLAWSQTLAPQAAATVNTAAGFVLDLPRVTKAQRKLRRDFLRTFHRAGYAPAPTLLLDRKDVDDLLACALRDSTERYLESEIARTAVVKVTLLLVSGDADFLRPLKELHDRFGDALDIHVLSFRHELSSGYRIFPWITTHYWEDVLKAPAST